MAGAVGTSLLLFVLIPKSKNGNEKMSGEGYAVRQFRLSAIPVQKVHKWGRTLGVATDALEPLCLRFL